MRYAKKMPGGYKPVRFARKVLRQERFAEEIVTRRDLERRKREVLKVAVTDVVEGLRATIRG